jgi:hypothetical protein
MALDLNMGYYTIRLDPMAVEMCTIIFPFGKYSYLRLPMGMNGSADIFQAEMMDLMETLEYVQSYIDEQRKAGHTQAFATASNNVIPPLSPAPRAHPS